jgi:hypothetical protein
MGNLDVTLNSVIFIHSHKHLGDASGGGIFQEGTNFLREDVLIALVDGIIVSYSWQVGFYTDWTDFQMTLLQGDPLGRPNILGRAVPLQGLHPNHSYRSSPGCSVEAVVSFVVTVLFSPILNPHFSS